MKRSTMVPAVAVAAGLFGALFLSGCGTSLTPDELEKQVSMSYMGQTGTKLTSITCEEADTAVGSPISCEATNADGIKLMIGGKVTAYDEDSQTANFSWNATPVAKSGG